MRVNSIPWWLWLAPIALLFLAIARMPYGYYTVTRIAVAGFACFLALVGWEDSAISRMWSAILGCVAVPFVSYWPIAAPDVCDGTSAVGESRHRIPRRIRRSTD